MISSAYSPSGITVANTEIATMFRRYLLQKAMAVFKWTLPEQWSEKYFLYALYCNGTVAVFDTDKFGVIPQICGLSGYNVFYQPTGAIIANPLIKSVKPLKIGTECALLTLTEDYSGIMDLVNYYADLMALASECSAVNLINSRLAYVFSADNKATAETFKKAADQILSGQPYVVADKRIFSDDGSLKLQMFEQNLSQNFIAPNIMVLLRNIENQFCTDLGIPNCNTDKRERLVTDEVNSNNVETQLRAQMWLDHLKAQCEKIRAMFDVEIGVDWRAIK